MANVLLGAEDLGVNENFSAAVTGEGHTICTVISGVDAVETVLSEKPDLVFLEGSLPVFDGFETCRMLRDDPDVPRDLPIVLVLAQAVGPRKLERCGATDWVDKDLSTVALRDLLVRLLGDKAAC